MRYLAMIAIVSLLSACSPEAPSTPAPVEYRPASVAISNSPSDFLTLLNVERAHANLPVMSLSAPLVQAATSHADDMARRGYFDHRSPEGIIHSGRIRAAGCGARRMGETIANGQYTIESVLASWLASPAHRAILMDPKYAQIGLGKSGQYWVATTADSC